MDIQTVENFVSRVLKKLRLSVLRNSRIHKTSKIESGSTVVNTNMERHSFCGYNCSLINCNIGSFCSIGSYVSIGGGRHPVEYVSTSPVFLSHKDSVKAKLARHDYLPKIQTTIGNDVWIGERVLIKAGVRIGDGAVIGMGSVVTKDISPYSISAGSPAKHIRYRFPDEICESLLEIRWWDWPDEEIAKYGDYITDPEAFIKIVQSG